MKEDKIYKREQKKTKNGGDSGDSACQQFQSIDRFRDY